MKRIHFKHGFTYKGQPYGWHEKELYRLPFRSGLRNYPLKKLKMIKTGNQLGYCCSRDKLSSHQLRTMTHDIDVVVSIADKNIMPFVWFAFPIFLLIASCKTKPQIIIQRTDSVTITERIERDTTYVPLHDSALYELYLRCIDGRVVIDRELKQLGRMLRLSYELEGNTLRINSIIEDSLMHVVERLTREIERTRSEVITPVFNPDPPKETGLKWWQKPIVALLWFIAIIGAALIIYLVIRKLK